MVEVIANSLQAAFVLQKTSVRPPPPYTRTTSVQTKSVLVVNAQHWPYQAASDRAPATDSRCRSGARVWAWRPTVPRQCWRDRPTDVFCAKKCF